MSENIELQRQFGKGKKPSTLRNLLSAEPYEMSNFARRSEVTKVEQVAETSPPVPLGDTSRQIKAFSIAFDQLYQEFATELVKEYSQMRANYMVEYRTNYEQNAQRKEELMTEVSQEIENQNAIITNLKAFQATQKLRMQKVF